MPDDYQGPERRSEQDAYDAGRQDAIVTAQLRLHDEQIRSHGERLNAINGSIDRGARANTDLTKEVAGLRDEIAAQRADQDKRLAVDQALHKQLRDSSDQVQAARQTQISARMFWIGVATIAVMLAALMVAILNQGAHP